jgi:hypothetical protein
MSKLMKINPADNIYIVRIPLQENDRVEIEGNVYIVKKSLSFGHKVAGVSLNPGDKIIKFGVPIGSATKHIDIGEHIHLHNMKSDYLPTYTLSDEFVKK